MRRRYQDPTRKPPSPWRRFVVVGILILVAILLGKAQNDARSVNQLDPVTRAIQTVTRPIATAANSMMAGLGNFRAGFSDVQALQAENRALKNQVSANRLYTEQVTRLNREVDALRRLQAMPPVAGQSRLMMDIVGYFPDVNRITLPKGSADGIKPGMPVVTAAGLLATVQTVDRNSCQALLLTSPSSQLGALDLSRNPPSTGLLKGMDSRTLSFTLFEPKAPVEIGDVIVTSGFGPRIPRGLVIGRVIQVEDNPELGIKRALVDPEIEIGEVREVVVLR